MQARSIYVWISRCCLLDHKQVLLYSSNSAVLLIFACKAETQKILKGFASPESAVLNRHTCPQGLFITGLKKYILLHQFVIYSLSSHSHISSKTFFKLSEQETEPDLEWPFQT